MVHLTLRCSPEHWSVGFFFSLSYALPILFSLVYLLLLYHTLQRGSTKESSLMNRAFILLVSAPLVCLLSVAARAESLCLALSWALYMDIQRHFFSSQDLTLTRSPLCSGAILLTLCVFFILASNCGFH